MSRVLANYRYNLSPDSVKKLRWLRDQQQALVVERRRLRGHGTRTRASYQTLVQYLFSLVSAHLLKECDKINLSPLPMDFLPTSKRTTTAPPKTKVDELT